MYKDKSILAIVPARGGSKGVPLKNIRPVHGIPLIVWVANVVKQVPAIDKTVVSTDHDEIARIAEEAGLAVPFRRPDALSGDRIGDTEVLNHALVESERIYGRKFDVILMLQPTSPLRTRSHIEHVLDKLIDEKRDAVWTVSQTDLKYHPFKQLTIEGNALRYFDENGKKIIARQQLTPVYHRNGLVYAMTRDCLLNQQSCFGKNTGAVIVVEPVVNMDTIEDFEKLEEYVSNRNLF